MDTTEDERREPLDPGDDPPTPAPEIDTDLEVGGGDVLVPDDDEEVKPDASGTLGREERLTW